MSAEYQGTAVSDSEAKMIHCDSPGTCIYSAYTDETESNGSKTLESAHERN